MFDEDWPLVPAHDGPPEAYRLTFGRHNGRRLGDAYSLDPDYFQWLAGRGPDLQVRQLAQAVMDSPPVAPEPFQDPYIDGDWPEYVHNPATKGIDM